MVYSSYLGVFLHYQWPTVWGFSTNLCTGVLKAVINYYLNEGSKVFACLIDTSKALIWLTTVFSLISCWKGVCTPKPVVRLLLRWYKSQQLCICWMGRSSDYFQVTNGVRQGGVLSPILFIIYLDSLLEYLQASGRGPHWDNYFAGVLCYADELTILAPSPVLSGK